MSKSAEHAQQSLPRGSRVSVIAGSDAGEHRVFTIKQAAAFLHLHPVTLQRMAQRGQVPAAKLGRRWIFLEIDLIACLRAQYPLRVMQGEYEEVKLCRSTNARIRPCIGSSSTTGEKSYRKALGLPIR